MYSETITLFNRYHSRQGDMWYPHILRNVDLIVDKASIMAKYGAETNDTAKLHIKCKFDKNQISIDGIPYISPSEWNNLLNSELADYITFNTDANYFDFFIVGEYDGGVAQDGIESFYQIMKEKYECYALTSASNPYRVIPHFEIMAK